MRLFAIVNPASANGKTGKQWPGIYERLQREFSLPFEFRSTEGQGHATDLARQALSGGFDAIIAVGGDGTVNEVVNGLIDGDGRFYSGVSLGILSLGTGKDFIRTLEIPEEVSAAARVIFSGFTKRYDIGKITFVDGEGTPRSRFFINVAGLGFSAAVVERVNRTSKALGGFVSYLVGLFCTLVTYKNKSVLLQIDDTVESELVINSINVANGRYFGGGMIIAPEARADDGFFDIAVIKDITRLNLIGNVKKLYNGTLASHPLVEYYKGRKVVVTSNERVLVDLDGEQPGMLPVTFEIVPKAAKILVPE